MGYSGGLLWSDEKTAQLKNLIEIEGLSARHCAQRLGVTRDAVIGRAFRKGLKFKRLPYASAGIPRVRRKPEKTWANLGWRLTAGAQQKANREQKVTVEPVVDIVPLDFTIMQLVDGVCRWPVGQGPAYFYCGHPTVEGKAYCYSHCCAAYQPLMPRPRKHDRSEFPRDIGLALQTYAKKEGVKEQTVIREAVAAYLGVG